VLSNQVDVTLLVGFESFKKAIPLGLGRGTQFAVVAQFRQRNSNPNIDPGRVWPAVVEALDPLGPPRLVPQAASLRFAQY